MKENKNIIVGVIVSILIIILGVIIGCKIFNIIRYKTDFNSEEYQDILSRLQIKDTINVKSTILNDSEYISFNGLKINIDLEDYEMVHNDTDTITYENKDKNILVSISGLKESIIEKIKKSEFLELNSEELLEILERNNIKNDYDLIKYISTQKNKNNNLFTNIDDMKENYFMYFITYIHMSVGENVTLIEGDYEGYILNMYDDKSINIIKDNKTYTFFVRNMNDNEINKLLNTLVIE